MLIKPIQASAFPIQPKSGDEVVFEAPLKGTRLAYNPNGSQLDKESGAPLIQLNANVSDVTIRITNPIKIQDFYSFVRAWWGGNKNIKIVGIDGSLIFNTRIAFDLTGGVSFNNLGFDLTKLFVQGYSKGGVRICGHDGFHLADSVFDSMAYGNDNFAVGLDIGLDNSKQGCKNVLAERSQFKNHRWGTLPGYRNGDGIKSQTNSSNIQLIDCVTSDNDDGGIDLASKQNKVIRHLSQRNGYNYKVWFESDFYDCISEFPTGVHVDVESDVINARLNFYGFKWNPQTDLKLGPNMKLLPSQTQPTEDYKKMYTDLLTKYDALRVDLETALKAGDASKIVIDDLTSKVAAIQAKLDQVKSIVNA